MEKQHQVQHEIDEAKGDYRNVESRTKELNGIPKRRGTLEEELVARPRSSRRSRPSSPRWSVLKKKAVTS